MASPSNAVVAIGLVLNIAFSISIVFVNKVIYTRYGFPNVTLTCLHFVMTSIGLLVCYGLGLFKPKQLPMRHMLPLAFTFCGFVVFTNLSLQHNTVGTYQLIKIMTMPCIMLIQTYFYDKSFSTRIKLVVIPIAFGVFLNSYSDVKFNLLGITYASIGVVVTSLYQVWVGSKQKEFEVNSMQLLFYQAPLSATLLGFFIMVQEPLSFEFSFFREYSTETLIMVVLSAVIAFSVNLSIYWVIGNTSPVTYNMVGHLKFCMTVVGGSLIFHDPLNFLQVIGILTTLGGVITYTHFKMQENKVEKEAQESLPTTNPSTENHTKQ